MKRVIFVISILALALPTFAVAPPLQTSTRAAAQGFDEEFNSSTLDPAWQVVTQPRSSGISAPANHISLTDNPGHLRYYVDPFTSDVGFTNNYQPDPEDPGLELHRSFTGDNWLLEAKVDYYLADSNGRSFILWVAFGNGGPTTPAVRIERYEDLGSGGGRNELDLGIGEGEGLGQYNPVTLNLGYPPPSDYSSFTFRVKRQGTVITVMWSLDGTTWNTAVSQDMGAQIQGQPESVIISGGSWFAPAGAYADYDYVRVTPLDTTPPVITPTVTGTHGKDGWYTSDVSVSWSVTDPESAITSTSGCETSTVTADTAGTTFTCTATSAGGTASRSVTIKRDATPPSLACSASPNTLWPPNHRLVPVAVTVNLSDALSGPAGFTLLSATSSEADNGFGDGNTSNDIRGFVPGTASTAGSLRAERSGNGSGRVYTLAYRGMDGAGNSSTCTMTVVVPHDNGH